MSIPDHARANFQTLLHAAADGNLALMECADAATGETRYVICAVGRDGADFLFTPFGHLRLVEIQDSSFGLVVIQALDGTIRADGRPMGEDGTALSG